MLVLLSPAKSLNAEVEDATASLSKPGFDTETAELLQILQSYSKTVLQQTLGISPALASLNQKRYQSWSRQDCKAAGYAFNGPAYKALDLRSLQEADVQFAQQHVRILDALYGILKPLDPIKPYRLEMSSRLQTSRGKSLYAFWGNLLSEALDKEMEDCPSESAFIVNCASQEYFKAVDQDLLHYPVYTMCFPGPAVYAKAARGAMVRFIVQEKVHRPEQLQAFTGAGLNNKWTYSAQESNEHQYTFIRGAVRNHKRERSESVVTTDTETHTRTSRKSAADVANGGKGSSKPQQ